MDKIIEAILQTNFQLIEKFVKDIIYDTIPHGDVLRRIAQEPKTCRVMVHGCNSCYHEEHETFSTCTAALCSSNDPVYCEQYLCRDDEIHIVHDENGPLGSLTNMVCGTNVNVTRAGCACKVEYSYRDKGSFKCVNTC